MVTLITTDKDIKNFLPIVATKEYLESKASRFGWFLSNSFVLPFIIERKLFFKWIRFTHETIYLGNGPSLGDEKEFLNQVVDFSRSLDVDFIYQPLANVVFNTCPDGSTFAPFGSYRVDLDVSETQLFKGIHQKHRNVIRKAERDGVLIRSGHEYLPHCHRLIKSTMERSSMRYVSIDELLKFKENLGRNLSLYIALINDEIQGCAVIVWSKGYSAYYLHGGSIPSPYTGSLNLLQWQAMKDMKNEEVRFYDFVGARIKPIPGSKQETMQRFKSRFGTTMKEGYLWRYPLKCWKYNLFRQFSRAYALMNRLDYKSDIIDQEIRSIVKR